MSNRIFSAIANKKIDRKELLEAIQQLRNINESSDFWNDIANSDDYEKFHRAHCIFQLFQRHVLVGTSISRFGELLKNPKWLKDEDVDIVNVIDGETPVAWTLDSTIFVFRIFSELSSEYNFAIYLRVLGKIGRDDLIRLLRDNEVDQETKDATILEVGFTGKE